MDGSEDISDFRIGLSVCSSVLEEDLHGASLSRSHELNYLRAIIVDYCC